MSNDSGMPVPEWAGEMRDEMMGALSNEKDMGVTAKSLAPVIHYSTFFAEWERREMDILVHFFPRNGKEDTWEEGSYLPLCRECRYELTIEDAQNRKPCPRCKSVGLVYKPGRREGPSKAKFHPNVLEMIKGAVDDAWTGDFALDVIKELGAVAVQIQDANLSDEVLAHMLETMFDSLDTRLDSPA